MDKLRNEKHRKKYCFPNRNLTKKILSCLLNHYAIGKFNRPRRENSLQKSVG